MESLPEFTGSILTLPIEQCEGGIMMTSVYDSIMTGLTEALEDAGSNDKKLKKTGRLCDTRKGL